MSHLCVSKKKTGRLGQCQQGQRREPEAGDQAEAADWRAPQWSRGPGETKGRAQRGRRRRRAPLHQSARRG